MMEISSTIHRTVNLLILCVVLLLCSVFDDADGDDRVDGGDGCRRRHVVPLFLMNH